MPHRAIRSNRDVTFGDSINPVIGIDILCFQCSKKMMYMLRLLCSKGLKGGDRSGSIVWLGLDL
eukprot:818028-Ditylum_brightwellii.AAC.1